MATAREIINQAMQSGSLVWIKYRDYNGKVTTREINPLEWDRHLVRSFCFLRYAERHFNVFNILDCRLVEGLSEAAALLQEERKPPPRPTQMPVIRPRQQPPRSPQTRRLKPFSQCKDADQWTRLVSYYRECLQIENRQQFIVDRHALLFLDSSPADTRRFLAGTNCLEFSTLQAYPDRPTPIAEFIQQEDKGKDRQLCLGFPVLILKGNQVAPLIYCPTNIARDQGRLILQAEGFEISYAALTQLDFSAEEIDHFLAECAEFEPDPVGDAVEQLETFVAERIAEQLQQSIGWSDTLVPYTLHKRPALFWVQENTATVNLIRELGELAETWRWQHVPQALITLLSITPRHDYPEAPFYGKDPNIYVTAVNSRQIQAATAAEQEQLTVVTGPPGTGKSQLVLNVIANAFFRGERILFASRNNKAVDVVMDRLLRELDFKGAVRTGNKRNRLNAAEQIKSALDRSTAFSVPAPVNEVRQRYQSGRDAAVQARKKLEQVRELMGLSRSHQAERETRLLLLPRPVAKYAVETVPDYNATDIERLRVTLSELLQDTLELNERQSQLEREFLSVVSENHDNDPTIAHLRDYEDQWGSFGDGFLQRDSFMTTANLQEHLQTWLALLDALETHRNLSQQDDHYRSAQASLDQHSRRVSQQLGPHIERLAAERQGSELSAIADQFEKLCHQFERIGAGRLGLWDRLLSFLRFPDPHVRACQSWASLMERVAIDRTVVYMDDPVAMAVACSEAADVLRASILRQRLDAAQAALNFAQVEYDKTAAKLPESMQADLGKMKPISASVVPLRSVLSDRLDSVDQLQTEVDQLGMRTNELLDGNACQSQMIAQSKASKAGSDRRLWQVRIPVSLMVLARHVTKWQNLVSFWAEDAAVSNSQRKLDALPSEEDALEAVKRTSSVLLELGGEFLRGSWVERARQASNEELRRAGDYASAMEALAGEYDPLVYHRAKSTAQSAFKAALTIFPIWATTNLSTKSNFPLEAELFDLLIIDEASQCDLPSALPLLYRARRAMIIGDRNQLKHVATISEAADVEAAARFGVAQGAFLYRNRSLFDLAKGSVGTEPGTLLLDEHFRSDARIIQFSNREFYDSRLTIKTDLTLSRGIRRSFLNTYGGMYWLHVPGVTQHPEGRGSAYNESELDIIGDIVPRLRENLKAHGLESLDIGIVTPYREQERRLRDQLSSLSPAADILAGTAHKFQGDERDIIIFSPVLAPGIKQGSLDWLARTKNLLNVAVTRARVALIVVGDWDYCCSLPAENPFRRLVGYVQGLDGRLFRNVDDLPLLGGEPYDITAYVLDPHNPEHSRATLRRFLTSCREYVWWFDNFFDDRVLQLFWDVFQDTDSPLRQVRLLTAREQIRPPGGGKPSLRPEAVRSLRHDLASRGVELEMRSLPKKELRVHDRLLFHPAQAINMPPFMAAIGKHKYVSEYTLSNIDQTLFEELWQRAEPVE